MAYQSKHKKFTINLFIEDLINSIASTVNGDNKRVRRCENILYAGPKHFDTHLSSKPARLTTLGLPYKKGSDDSLHNK